MDFLPSQTIASNSGKPIPKVSRVDRKSAKAAKKAEEDKRIGEAVKAASPKRKPIGARLRAMVLERDGFKCVRCGADASSERADGTTMTLHVDHIVPVAAGGTNCESNLRTLCATCNLGRGARRDPTTMTVNNDDLVKKLTELVEAKGARKGAK